MAGHSAAIDVGELSREEGKMAIISSDHPSDRGVGLRPQNHQAFRYILGPLSLCRVSTRFTPFSRNLSSLSLSTAAVSANRFYRRMALAMRVKESSRCVHMALRSGISVTHACARRPTDPYAKPTGLPTYPLNLRHNASKGTNETI